LSYVRNSSIEDAQFNTLLLEVIDRSLADSLGEEVRNVVYLYLKAVLFLKKEDIPKELVAFHAGLIKLFGSSATLVEDVIVKELFSKIGVKFSAKDTFVNLVEKARTYFVLSKKKKE